jgi:outer membrane protein assembly factor BamC
MPVSGRPCSRQVLSDYRMNTTLFKPALLRLVILTSLSAGLIACAATESMLPDRRPDYRQSKVLAPLEVPPDLTSSTIDDTLVVPELNPTGSATLSDYAGERNNRGQLATPETVLPDQPGISLERDGKQRWLVTEQEPSKLWPRIKEFWTSNGFVLKQDDPRIGVMETDWAENRADIPEGPIRAVLKKFLDVAYSAPTRDKFRVRLERLSDTTEIYLTHYGVEEVAIGGVGAKQGENFVWQPRPSDPELEAEMLSRLMVYLGASEKRAEAQLARTSTAPQVSKVRREKLGDGQEALVIEEDYARSWRLVGLALDSSNFVVEDQNRNQGLYLVEYKDPVAESKDKGFLSRLAFWKNKPLPRQGVRYQVRLAGQGQKTLVVVRNAQGQPDNSSTAQLILSSLQEVIR